MNKEMRIKNKLEFDNFIKTKPSVKNSFFVVHYNMKKEKSSRYGIAVGTAVGNAVTRNKLKRRMREIIKEVQNLFQKDLDYIIIVRKRCLELNYHEMKEQLIKLIEESDLK